METKKLKTPVFTSDLYYDLIEGGYLKPKNFLKNSKDVKQVTDAIELIRVYLAILENRQLIEIG